MRIPWAGLLLGLIVGAALAWALRGQDATAKNRSVTSTAPSRAGAPTSHDSTRWRSEPAPRESLTPHRGRPTYDLTSAPEPYVFPVDTVRDPEWAPAMEAAMLRHSKRELIDLMPDAEWVGVSCMTRTCEVRYRTKPQAPEVMAVVQSFVFGPGTVHGHELVPAPNGATEWVVSVEFRDDVTYERVSADDYLARQATRESARQALRDQVRDHFHNHPDDQH